MSTTQLPASHPPDASETDGGFYEHEVFLGVDGRLYGMHRVSDPDAGEWREDEEIRAHFTNDGLFGPPIEVQGGAQYEGESLHGGDVMFYAFHHDVTPPIADGTVQPLVGAVYTRAPGSRVRRSRRQRRAGRRCAARSPGGSDDPEPHPAAVALRGATCCEGVRS
jgi:hypothetical protein